jgi:hypothetical protein
MTATTIRITTDRKRGLWAAEVVRSNGRTTRSSARIAAQTQTSATSHSLCVLALASSLKSLPRQLGKRETVRVAADDPTFSRAMNALMKRDMEQLEATPLRCGKNLLKLLPKPMAKFEMIFETEHEEQSNIFKSLRKWMRGELRDPNESTEPILSPSAVSQLFWKARPQQV